MFELFVGSDAVKRHVERPLKPDLEKSPRPSRTRRQRPTVVVRTASAAALRSLAERLEPSPSR